MKRSAAPAAPAEVRQTHALAGAQVYSDTVKLVLELARNPVVEMIVAFTLIEKLQQRGVLSQPMGTMMEAGMAGIITAQQLAPLASAIAQGAQGLPALAGLFAALPGPP